MTNVVLWVAVPYITITVFVVGHYWRYRYDKVRWTTRSSQLYERRLLRLGSPMFHFGILLVALGHIGGLLVPESWTNAVGISETAYHVVAVGLGTRRGVLHARRRRDPHLPAPHRGTGVLRDDA